MFALALLLAVAAPSHDVAAQDFEVSDPWENVNRGIFSFNDSVDTHVLEPVAQAYQDNVSDTIQDGIGNFFLNLRYPVYLVSDLVQFKFSQALDHTGRFLLNTTVGLLGIIDVAKEVGLPDHEEDFGLALAYHGVPPGPYIMLPILGPSNVRDAFGRLVDTFLDPFALASYTGNSVEVPVVIGAKVVQAVDTRADLLDAIKTAKESSVDYYLFVQGAYYQHRRGLLYDGDPPGQSGLSDDDEELPSGALGGSGSVGGADKTGLGEAGEKVERDSATAEEIENSARP